MLDLAFHSKTLEMIGALILVLLLFVLCMGSIKGLRHYFSQTKTSLSSRQLYLKESLMLDAKRRLVRIQNKDKEHLILLGPSHDLLLQSTSLVATNRENFSQKVSSNE